MEIALPGEVPTKKLSQRRPKKKGIFRKLSGKFDRLTKRQRNRIQIEDLELEIQEYRDKLNDKDVELGEKEYEIAELKKQISLCDNELDKILEAKIMGNLIIGNNNIMVCNRDNESLLVKKINRLFQMCSDEFTAVAERHASLEWKMESVEVSNINEEMYKLCRKLSKVNDNF